MKNRLVCVGIVSACIVSSCKLRNDSALREEEDGGEVVEGVVSVFGKSRFGQDTVVATFSTPEFDYSFDIPALSPEIRAKMEESVRYRKRIRLSVEGVPKSPAPLNVRPDCGERPMTYDELKSVAESSSDINDFLGKIPKGSLQNFTFVHGSNSPLKDEVDPQWPRVLRSSTDMKLIMSYGCKQDGPHYNKVELIRFDDEKSEFLFSEFSFTGGQTTVREDPPECLNCHAPNFREKDPRPNWQSYFTWDGVYGRHDDQLGGKLPNFTNGRVTYNYLMSAPYDRPEVPVAPVLAEEVQKYEEFRRVQKDNPCYALLPWPDTQDSAYKHYPYSLSYKPTNYHLRVNLKFTEGMAHLMGKRMARKFLENPKFKPLRYLAIMEAAECLEPNVDDYIKQSLSRYRPPRANVPDSGIDQYQQYLRYFDPRLSQGGGPRLFAIGKALRFSHADWTMTFNQPADPVYNTGLTSGINRFDASILQVAQAEILDSLTLEFPSLSRTYTKSRGESRAFGDMFQCVDDLGGHIVWRDKQRACTVLKAKMAENRQADLEAAKEPFAGHNVNPSDPTEDGRRLATSRDELDMDLVQQGKSLAQEKCQRCHNSGPQTISFFSSRNTLQVKLRSNTDGLDFIFRVFDRIDSEQRPMPPGGLLTEDERAAIREHLNEVFIGDN